MMAKFTSGSKRVPHPISYNVDDELALSIKCDLSEKHIKEIFSKVKIPPFVSKKSASK